MKHAIVILVTLFRVSLAFAELPLSLTEALFDITGGKDYEQWLKLHGLVKFPKKFSCFQRGVFRSRFDKNPPFGLRYEIVMQHEFVEKTSVDEVVPDIKKAEEILLKRFKHSRFCVTVSSNKYHSVCRDIDGRGWSAEFSITQIGVTNAPIAAARFYNPLHRDGRFRSCEDFADASKSKPNLPESFSIVESMVFERHNDNGLQSEAKWADLSQDEQTLLSQWMSNSPLEGRGSLVTYVPVVVVRAKKFNLNFTGNLVVCNYEARPGKWRQVTRKMTAEDEQVRQCILRVIEKKEKQKDDQK